MRPQIHISGFNCRIVGETDTHYLVRVLGERQRTLPDLFENVSVPSDKELALEARLRKDHPDIEFIDWTKRRIRYKGYVLQSRMKLHGRYHVWACPESPLPHDLLEDMQFPGKLEYEGKIAEDDPGIQEIEELKNPTTPSTRTQ